MPKIMRAPLSSQSINHQTLLPLRKKTFTDEQFELFFILNDIGELVGKLWRQHTGVMVDLLMNGFKSFKHCKTNLLPGGL